ncbi:MAG TPA: nickel pincer cofactor biosynthesis protein LarC [Patescibacteria group bacterium]|nr:nickel pincer cofactor biosynthesis protein LarC [Patescibacteria group bacterium]
MAQELLFQTNCGAAGDMILAAMIDLLDAGEEFKKTFENIGLNVTVTVEDTEKNHLRCKMVTVASPAADQAVTWSEIDAFITTTPFAPGIKANARRIFTAIFEAEAAVHGSKLENVHLHEIGAADSLVDILGFCFLWEKLDCCPIYFTTLVTGHGNIQTRHGLLPVPPPAVLRLVRGFLCRNGGIEGELLTPTGAAILTTFGRQADAERTAKPIKTGCGCGHRTYEGMPNLLRTVLEERDGVNANDRIWVLECNVDDMGPELLAAAADKILQAGAVDIFIASGLMKKGRLGFNITVLCSESEHEKVIAAVFRESTAIGLRQRLEERVILNREIQTLRVQGRDVRVKVSSWQNCPLNVKPEFADVCHLAEELNIPVKQAMLMAQGAVNEKYGYK